MMLEVLLGRVRRALPLRAVLRLVAVAALAVLTAACSGAARSSAPTAVPSSAEISLVAPSASHPLNRELRTDVEIVIEQRTGRLLRMGILRTSGVTTFDIEVLDAITRAQPFGPAPEIIASADGNVYVRWEFHRDPVDACSTRNARPHLWKSPR